MKKHALARLVLLARNPKLGRVANTHVPIAQTCPRSCPFLNNGCYAQRGQGVYQLMRRLEQNARRVGATALDVARAEAHEIVKAAKSRGANGRPLRLHYSGDAPAAGARLLAKACARWPGKAWTYTLAWRDVPRGAWGSVSVLASVEDTRERVRALERRYAAAVLLEDLPKDGKSFARDGVTRIPTRRKEFRATAASSASTGLAWRKGSAGSRSRPMGRGARRCLPRSTANGTCPSSSQACDPLCVGQDRVMAEHTYEFVVDTNVMLDTHTCSDLASAVNAAHNNGEFVHDNRMVFYRRVRARRSLLLAMHFHNTTRRRTASTDVPRRGLRG